MTHNALQQILYGPQLILSLVDKEAEMSVIPPGHFLFHSHASFTRVFFFFFIVSFFRLIFTLYSIYFQNVSIFRRNMLQSTSY